MTAFPPGLERLVQLLTKLPGIGRKSATRIALRLVESSKAECREFAGSIVDARERTRKCTSCGGLTEEDPCSICRDARRDGALVCVVERPSDILALLDGIGPDDLRIDQLAERAADGSLKEVILALNPTAEGEATSLYAAKLLAPLDVRVTRLASGLPVGGDLDLADELTLGTALEERRDI